MASKKAMEFTLISTEASMKGSGTKTSNMDTELNTGQMAQHTTETINMDKSMAKESSSGQMIAPIMVNLLITTLRALVYTFGQMEESTTANGKSTKWMEMAFALGAMAESIQVNM